MVGDDASDEVGLRVVQRGHELGQGLLVELSHRAEHSLLGLRGARHGTVRHLGYRVKTDHSVRCNAQDSTSNWGNVCWV